jgi:polyisoprenoid-binding protein YceI
MKAIPGPAFSVAIVILSCLSAAAEESVLHCDAAQTKASIALQGNLHTVHGTFVFKRGELHFDPTSNAISGDIVFDATSGNTDNDSRNKKMNKDVLESQRYPEITFKPSHVDGKVAAQGSSTVQVKGMFGIHGSEHEITVPADVKFEGNHWNASVHFPVPYAQWGMKNPSFLFFKVEDSVEVEFKAGGSQSPSK